MWLGKQLGQIIASDSLDGKYETTTPTHCLLEEWTHILVYVVSPRHSIEMDTLCTQIWAGHNCITCFIIQLIFNFDNWMGELLF